MTCEARQYGDQTTCTRCRLVWDTNDTEPPACGKRGRNLYGEMPHVESPPLAPIRDIGLAAAVARLLSLRER